MPMAMESPYSTDGFSSSARGGRNISEFERWVSMASGAGLVVYGLSRRRGNGWILATLGGLLFRRGFVGHCVTYVLFDINTGRSLGETRSALGGSAGINVQESVTISRTPQELYRFWRSLENLPRFMNHLVSVERVTDTISRWRAQGPAGSTVEWNAEVINDVPNKILAWISLKGSDVVSAGSVNFEPASGGRATHVRVHLQYSPPAGKFGAAVARMMGADPATEIREDLNRFKQMVEAGQLV
jgi:uncharacterized membrane protein